MQGEQVIIDALNDVLTNELTAINQYFIHAKMFKAWGFTKLGKKIHDESIGEMKHADALIDRILYLEGVPEIARYHPIRVGKDTDKIFANDLALERSGVQTLNQHIALCLKHNDGGSRDLMEKILTGSEDHVDWLETQIDVISKIGLQNYLSEQL